MKDIITGEFQSTPSARRATVARRGQISRVLISIHALREEGDHKVLEKVGQFFEFQSTPSARRATANAFDISSPILISIHALREEGDHNGRADVLIKYISIHALREEGDSAYYLR